MRSRHKQAIENTIKLYNLIIAVNSHSNGQYKRTILITGATDGLGKQLAIELALNTRDNFVIVHGRAQRNCEKTLQEIAVEQKALAPSNVAFVVADFADFKQVFKSIVFNSNF
jgi:NAD(P)-dependent dehydrogenase (short-subunit alcohol dehydrogenase family)